MNINKASILISLTLFYQPCSFAQVDQTVESEWEHIHVDLKGKVKFDRPYWTQVAEGTYRHTGGGPAMNDTSFFYVSAEGGSLKRTIAISGVGRGTSFGSVYSSKYAPNGGIEEHTYCATVPSNCITLDKATCDDLLRFLKMDSSQELAKLEKNCNSLAAQKVEFWKKIRAQSSQASQEVTSKVRELTSFSKVIEESNIYGLDHAHLQAPESINYLSAMCGTVFWSKQLTSLGRPDSAPKGNRKDSQGGATK